VAEREARGDFDYLFDDPTDPADVEEVTDDVPAPETLDDDQWDEPDGNFWDRDAQRADNGQFDAFNTNTWYFRPAPAPWYRTRQAMTALIAAAAAMAAIVVSVVLLVFRAPDNSDDATTTVTPTAPTSAPRPTASSEAPPPPPPPPPPPETSAESVSPPPGGNLPRTRQRETKAPEIGVTRTPITRSPISVAPQPRQPRN
jgi:hypothetical protein